MQETKCKCLKAQRQIYQSFSKFFDHNTEYLYWHVKNKDIKKEAVLAKLFQVTLSFQLVAQFLSPAGWPMAEEKVVKLNVGGVSYQTSLTTLGKYPKSILAATSKLKKDENGSYFVEEDGELFR